MIAATLHGPNYFAPNHDETSIEVFPSIAEAIAALLDRDAANGRRAVTYDTLDGKHHLMQFPGFTEGTRFECYEIGPSIHAQHKALKKLHEKKIIEVLAAIHGGHRDWTLELTFDGERTGVMVMSA